MRFAYADPPYLGCCALYDHHHPCDWVLDLLNVWPGDEAVDLFPGTGVMGRRAAALSPTVPPEGLFAEVAP